MMEGRQRFGGQLQVCWPTSPKVKGRAVAELQYHRPEHEEPHASADVRVLRGAVYRGDGAAVVAALTTSAWGLWLQWAGDGLLVALASQTPAARDLANRCFAALAARDWPGDAELADQLHAALSHAPHPHLRPLAVDLDELAAIREGDSAEGGGRIDLATGDVWPQLVLDYAQEHIELGENPWDNEDPGRWLDVPCAGPAEGYRDMCDFIATMTDAARADQLQIAIGGRGAFRRFNDLVACWPEQHQRWHSFAEERRRGRARSWLAAAGYTPAVRRKATPDSVTR